MLAGRERELAAIAELLAAAQRGSSGTLVLRGDAGSGKSALLHAAAAQAAPDMRVLEARGVETEHELAYAGLHQLLRPVLPVAERLPEPLRDALNVALGVAEGTEADPLRVSLAALTLLAEATEEQPALCLVDDAHWIDTSSAPVIAFVARRLHSERIAVLIGLRDEPSSVLRDAGFDELRLSGLDVAAAAAVLRRAGPVVDEVVRRLTALTGGNPLALVEFSESLTSDQLCGREPLPFTIPASATAERLYRDKIDALPSDSRTLLLAAAADETMRPEIVARAAELLGLDLAALEPAEAAGLVRVEPGAVVFRHPLVRSAAYGSGAFADRQRVHRAVAAALEEAGELDRASWHLATATLTPDERVASALEATAARAHNRSAFTGAIAAYERAADLSVGARRAALLTAAAADACLVGACARAKRLTETALPLLDDPLARADAERVRAIAELIAGNGASVVAIVRPAVEEIAALDQRRVLGLLLVAAEAASFDLNREVAEWLAGQASVLTPPTEEEAFLANLLVGLSQYLVAGKRAAAVRTLRTVLGDVERIASPEAVLAAGRAAMHVGDDGASLRLHARFVERAREAGGVRDVMLGEIGLAGLLILAGDWDSGHAMGLQALRLAEDAGQLSSAHPLVTAAGATLVPAYRGDEDLVRETVGRIDSIRGRRRWLPLDDLLAWVEAAQAVSEGDARRAFRAIERIEHPVMEIVTAFDRIEIAYRAGEADVVSRWLSELEEFAVEAGAPWARALVEYGRALLADDGDERTARLEAALDHYQRGERPFDRARVALALGEHLRRQKRRRDARDHIREALEFFDEVRADPWIARAQAELRASGETARTRRTGHGVRELTPQELQVARLVAEGLSNKQIASRLFLSPRTIDFHLRNVFSKLSLSSRTELAAMFAAAA